VVILDVLSESRTSEKMRTIVDYIGKNKVRYRALMKVLFSDEFGKQRKVPMYAAWTMTHVLDAVPHLMQDYWAEMIAHLDKEKNSGRAQGNHCRNVFPVFGRLRNRCCGKSLFNDHFGGPCSGVSRFA